MLYVAKRGYCGKINFAAMRRYAADPNCPQPSVCEVNRLCELVKNGMEVEELSNFSEEEIVKVLKSKKQEFGKIIGAFCEGGEERLLAVKRAAQILNLNYT
jgi:hypothetical protein